MLLQVGVIVNEVVTGSPAHAKAVRVGSVVIAVGGVSVYGQGTAQSQLTLTLILTVTLTLTLTLTLTH